MDNPFFRIREQAEVDMAEFARALGVSLPSIQAVESGVTGDPSTILTALETLGHDPEKLRAEYQEWRKARAAEIRERLRF